MPYGHELTTAEAKYHTVCCSNILKLVPSPIKKLRQDNQVTQASKGIFNYIEKQKNSQFKLAVLKDSPKEYVLDNKPIISII